MCHLIFLSQNSDHGSIYQFTCVFAKALFDISATTCYYTKERKQTQRLVAPLQMVEEVDKTVGGMTLDITTQVDSNLQVIHLSDYSLSEIETRVLQRGLTFSPTQKLDKFTTIKDLYLFCR